ncbi:MAG: hypothetical protein HY381_01495, partial [Candidatus Chisholmbacteria bacterium]|nr:hypothetical protein [Candidatus Chisholmbacteria bacterium]
IGKTFFYYLPFIILGFHAFKLLRRQLNRRQITTFVYLGLFFLIGLRPTTDILHLSMIYPALFPLIAMIKPRWVLPLSFLVFSLGLGKLYLKPYAGFEAPYREQTHPVTIFNRETLLADHRATQLIQITEIIHNHTSTTEPIFVYPYAPMLYFLTGHPNATRYPLVTSGYLTLAQEQEIIADLAPVNLIVIQTGLTPTNPQPVYDYLTSHFTLIDQIGDYQIRLRD